MSDASIENTTQTESGNKGILSELKPTKTLDESLRERSDEIRVILGDKPLVPEEQKEQELKALANKALGNNVEIQTIDKPWKFKVGDVPNPKGKPKGKHMTTLVREALQKVIVNKNTLEEKTIHDALIEKITAMALEGNERMITLVWNYLDGLPQVNVDHTTDGKELPVPILQIFNKQEVN